MPLEFELESVDEVPEVLKEHYVLDEKSSKYVLQVNGVVPKTRLDEFRNNNINLAKERDRITSELEELKNGYGATPEEVAEMRKTLEGIKDKKILDDEGIDALVEKRLATLKADHESQLKALTKKNVELEQQAGEWSQKYRKTVINQAITDAAIKAGVRPQAIPDVVLRAGTMWTLSDQGTPVARIDNEIVYGRDGATPLSPEGWMESLKTEAPHFFEPSSGGGASGNNGAGGPGKTKVKFKSDLKSAADKSAFIQEHGYQAFARLPLSPN